MRIRSLRAIFGKSGQTKTTQLLTCLLIMSRAENEDTKSWGNAKSFGEHSENNCLKWCSPQIRQPKRLPGTMTWVLQHFGVPLLCLPLKRSDLPIVISTLIISIAKSYPDFLASGDNLGKVIDYLPSSLSSWSHNKDHWNDYPVILNVAAITDYQCIPLLCLARWLAPSPFPAHVY